MLMLAFLYMIFCIKFYDRVDFFFHIIDIKA